MHENDDPIVSTAGSVVQEYSNPLDLVGGDMACSNSYSRSNQILRANHASKGLFGDTPQFNAGKYQGKPVESVPGATAMTRYSGNMFEASTPSRQDEPPTPNEEYRQEVIISPPQLIKNNNYHTASLMSTDCQQAVQLGSYDLLLSRLIEAPHITSEAPNPRATEHTSAATIPVPSTN